MKTGHRKNHGKGFQVPCRSAQFRKCAEKFTTNRSSSVELLQNPAGGITVMPGEGVLKPEVRKNQLNDFPSKVSIFGVKFWEFDLK